MPTTVIERLVARIESDFGGFDADLRRLERKLDGLQKPINKVSRSLNLLARAFPVYALVRAVYAVGKAIVDVNMQMESLGNAMTAATGNSERATKEMASVRATATELGLSIPIAADGFIKLAAATRGTALEGGLTQEIFKNVSTAVSVLGLSADDAEGTFRALGQIMSKGKVQAEELRGQIGDRVPGAFQIAAKAMGVTTEELDKMLKKGKLMAEDFLPKFSRELAASVEPGRAGALVSMRAEFNRLGNVIRDVAVAIGKSGLNDFLKKAAHWTAVWVSALANLPMDVAMQDSFTFGGVLNKLTVEEKALAEQIKVAEAALIESNKHLGETKAMHVGLLPRIIATRGATVSIAEAYKQLERAGASAKEDLIDTYVTVNVGTDRVNKQKESIDKLKKSYAELIEKINKLKGIEAKGAAKTAAEIAAQELRDKIDKWDQSVISAQEAYALMEAKLIQLQARFESTGPDRITPEQFAAHGVEVGEEFKKNLGIVDEDKKKEDLDPYQSDREKLYSSLQMEEELLQESYQKRILMIEELRAKGAITNEAANAAQLRSEAMFQASMSTLTTQRLKAQLSTVQQHANLIAGAIGAGARKQFEIQKAFNIAGALIAARDSVVQSFNAGAKIGGPKLGFVYAAIAAVAQARNIAAIAKTKFGDKGNVSAQPAGGAGSPVVEGGRTTSGGSGGEGVTTTSSFEVPRTVNISLTGSGNYTRQQVIELVEQINEVGRSGVKIRVAQ